MNWELIYQGMVFAAEEMGVALKRSSLSPNIRERVDLSCCITDSHGKIVAQAEHIPVHLGSFRIGVQNILEWMEKQHMELNEGEMLLTNDPYISGTHLNDLMLLAPIHFDSGLQGYVVNKAHHVDVGGPEYGSINPNAERVEQEGVVIAPVKLVNNNSIDGAVAKNILSNFQVPSISKADLQAQVSANRIGIVNVKNLFQKYGEKDMQDTWKEAINHGRKLTLKEWEKWPEGNCSAEDYIEWKDLIPIRVSVEIRKHKIIFDFDRTSKQIRAPLNAVYGVTFSACAFPIRCLLSKQVPTNEGFYV